MSMFQGGEEIVEVAQIIPQERVSRRIVEDKKFVC